MGRLAAPGASQAVTSPTFPFGHSGALTGRLPFFTCRSLDDMAGCLANFVSASRLGFASRSVSPVSLCVSRRVASRSASPVSLCVSLGLMLLPRVRRGSGSGL